MHHPTDRIIHTTAFVKPVVEHWLEREIAQWVHQMKDRSDDPSHHELHGATSRSPSRGTLARTSIIRINMFPRDEHVPGRSHGAMGRRIDPSWWTHWAISRSSQCPATRVTKAVVCVIVCGVMHIKAPLLLIEKSSICGGSGFPLSLSEWFLNMFYLTTHSTHILFTVIWHFLPSFDVYFYQEHVSIMLLNIWNCLLGWWW